MKINGDAKKTNSNNYRIDNDKIKRNKSFEYKIKIIGSTPNDNNTLDTEVVVLLTYLSNFWRFPDLPCFTVKQSFIYCGQNIL